MSGQKLRKKPALIYFPQWQGTGVNNAVQTGSETLRSFFENTPAVIIPLSDKALTTRKNIIAYEPLTEQLTAAKQILEQNNPERLVLIAGDCATEIAPILHLNKMYNGRLIIIWLDAHGDLNTPIESPSGHFHGMPLRLMLDDGFAGISVDKPLKSDQVILIGVRDLDIAEKQYIDRKFISVVGNSNKWQTTSLDWLAKQEAENVYIHLDLDVLDPSVFPAVQCPVANGFLPCEVANFISKIIKTYNVVGLSLTETIAESQIQLQPITSIVNIYQAYLE